MLQLLSDKRIVNWRCMKWYFMACTSREDTDWPAHCACRSDISLFAWIIHESQLRQNVKNWLVCTKTQVDLGVYQMQVALSQFSSDGSLLLFPWPTKLGVSLAGKYNVAFWLPCLTKPIFIYVFCQIVLFILDICSFAVYLIFKVMSPPVNMLYDIKTLKPKKYDKWVHTAQGSTNV